MLLVFSAILFSCSKPQQTTTPSLLGEVGDTLILPAYTLLGQQLQLLQQSANSCSKDGNTDALKQQWQQSMAAWQRIQWLQFGPISEESRNWQFQFWPDTKNIIGRKITGLLKQAQLDTAALEGAGLITKGLPSVEYLLFDKKALAHSAEKRCQFIAVIAESMQRLSQTLIQEWPAFYQQQLSQQRQYSDTTSGQKLTVDQQSLAMIINSLVQQLDIMTDQKLAKPLAYAENSKRINLYFMESWRSGNSVINLQHNISGLKAVFQSPALSDYITRQGHGALLDKLQVQLASLESQELNAQVLGQGRESHHLENYDVEKQNPEAVKQALQTYYNNVNALRTAVKVDLVKALGVRLGFNSSDGDS